MGGGFGVIMMGRVNQPKPMSKNTVTDLHMTQARILRNLFAPITIGGRHQNQFEQGSYRSKVAKLLDSSLRRTNFPIRPQDDVLSK